MRKKNILPGFGITMGFTLSYLGLIVLIPLAGLFLHLTGMSWQEFREIIGDPRVTAAFRVTFGISFLAALANAFFGFIAAWVLVRYTFPGRRFFDAMIDLPFAVPTAVSGITLSMLYSEQGWFGRFLPVQVTETPLGIFVALTFIGLPFVVRTMQPALTGLEKELEEASASLGATRWQTFWKVLFPGLLPALLTGFTMAFARAVGEYGSVIFIAGNMPYKTEIVPLLIFIRLEQYDFTGAVAIAVFMLIVSFVLLLLINLLQLWRAKRTAG
ncbi:MAG: sulfate ABC transporter permease subunit CysT [Planctomycetaceae bacterium]|jgi:sulfate transport system permease protein|nr:sulfate ABC transporter permease subunit CysT [Planctomycetaceae bacterium]